MLDARRRVRQESDPIKARQGGLEHALRGLQVGPEQMLVGPVTQALGTQGLQVLRTVQTNGHQRSFELVAQRSRGPSVLVLDRGTEQTQVPRALLLEVALDLAERLRSQVLQQRARPARSSARTVWASPRYLP